MRPPSRRTMGNQARQQTILNHTESHLKRLSVSRVRFYVTDYVLLATLERDGYGYARQLAPRLRRSPRRVQAHLTKLEQLNLVERHGTPNCCFQWWNINETSKRTISELISYLRAQLRRSSPKKSDYVTFENLPVAVPRRVFETVLAHGLSTFKLLAPRRRNEPERAYNRSLPHVPFCQRGQACPFPVCIRGLSHTWAVSAALLARAEAWLKAVSSSYG